MAPLLDKWPEGPPNKNVGMVEALGKAWSWRMPLQKWMPSTTTTSHQPERHLAGGQRAAKKHVKRGTGDPCAPKREPERTSGIPRGSLKKNPKREPIEVSGAPKLDETANITHKGCRI